MSEARILTLQDARDICARFVENGSCDISKIDAYITEACQRLLDVAEWPHDTQWLRIYADNGQFPLPRECAKIIHFNVDGRPAKIFNAAYEFLQNGPGEFNPKYPARTSIDLIDAGFDPLMYDIPLHDGELYIVAFSTEAADRQKVITLYGWNHKSEEIGTVTAGEFSPGETLAINLWENGVEGLINGRWGVELHKTVNPFKSVRYWSKPKTAGYITLYAVNPNTNEMFFLAKAHPDDLQPSWRRYRILGKSYTYGVNIYALCKMQALDLTHPSDVLPIQSLAAIKNMIIAINYENVQNLKRANEFEANALRILNKKLQNHVERAGMPILIDTEREVMAASTYRGII